MFLVLFSVIPVVIFFCATHSDWAANLLIGSTFLSLMDAITPAGAFGLYAGFCFLGWLFCFLCYPET